MVKSIMQNTKVCFLCGRTGYLERHHIYFGANRKHAETHGLWVWLCPECHRTGPSAAHRDDETNRQLKRIGQQTFERTHTRAEFMRIFGRNYLDD